MGLDGWMVRLIRGPVVNNKCNKYHLYSQHIGSWVRSLRFSYAILPFAPRLKVRYYVLSNVWGDWTWAVDMVFYQDVDMRGGILTGHGQMIWSTDWTLTEEVVVY